MNLQRLGGYAAIASVCVFVIVVFVFPILVQNRFGILNDPAKAIAAVSAAPAYFYVPNLLYIICWILIQIVFFALYERMQAQTPHLIRIALIAASVATTMEITSQIIWSKFDSIVVPTPDVSVFRAFNGITAALNAMGGHSYGWAFLLIGCAILRTCTFSQILGWLLLLEGILMIPNFFFVQIGIGLITLIIDFLGIMLFIWIGIALLQRKQLQPASKEMAASS
jgi:hypothetical protein